MTQEAAPQERRAALPKRRRFAVPGRGHKTLRVYGAAFALSLLLLGAGTYGLLRAINEMSPVPWPSEEDASTVVLDRSGALLRAFTTHNGRWRLPIDVQDVDPRYLRMLIAYEDRRFLKHRGIDPFAVLRASWQMLTQGRVVSGASTLTMQVARLLEPRADRSVSAKLRQMIRAIEIDHARSKAQILDLYLALAPYGGNIEGLRAASFAYFGKEPKRLSIGEAAFLVGLPQSPETRRPDRSRKWPSAPAPACSSAPVNVGSSAARRLNMRRPSPSRSHGRPSRRSPRMRPRRPLRQRRASACQAYDRCPAASRARGLGAPAAGRARPAPLGRHPRRRQRDGRVAGSCGIARFPFGKTLGLDRHDARLALAGLGAEALHLRACLRGWHRPPRDDPRRSPGSVWHLCAGEFRPGLPRRGHRAARLADVAQPAGGVSSLGDRA